METKKDALTGVRLGAFSRVVACALTVMLAAGMVPSGAIAYAAEDSGSAAGAAAGSDDAAQGEGSSAAGSSSGATSAGDRVNEDVALDTSGSASGEGGANASSGSDEAASNGAASGGATKYTGAGSGQTSADVSLDGTAKVGTIEYGGLAYTINEDDPATVSVTGLASSAPKGDLVIPSQVVCGSDLYRVTKIARGGGSLR